MTNVITKAVFKVLDSQPLKALASSPSTPVFVLDFLWTASQKNPFNRGFVPQLWEPLLSNPSMDLSKHEECTRQSLVKAKIKNPNATASDLAKIADDISNWDYDFIQKAALRKVKEHKNATAETTAKVASIRSDA